MRAAPLLVAILTLSSLMSGCARPHAADAPAIVGHAGLEVVNRSGTDLEIDVAGRTVGVVEKGARARFRTIRPGRWLVRAGNAYQRSLEFERGEVTLWEIVPTVARADQAVPPGFGSLKIRNVSGRLIEVELPPAQPRALLTGDTRQLDDLPSGDRKLHVRVPGHRYHRTIPIRIEVGKTRSVDVSIESGEVRVENYTGEAVLLVVDGIDKGSAPSGQTHVLRGLVPGVHKLRAHGTRTGKEHFRTLRIEAEASVRWDLSASQGKLVVTNRTGEPFELIMDGKPLGRVEPGKPLRIGDAPLGLRHLVARGTQSHHRWVAEVPMSTGQEHRWVIRGGGGTLWVRNELREPVDVRIDDEPLGTVGPESFAFYGDLDAGMRAVTVFGKVSHVLQKQMMRVASEDSAEWTVREPEACLHVRNRTAEPVLVYADQKRLGRVPSGGDIVFTQVPPGERLIEARGEITGEVTRKKLQLTTAETFAWDVRASLGRIRVVNRSGEVLVPPPTLRPQAESVDNGTEHVFSVPVGHRIVHLIGRKTGQSYFERFTIREGETERWLIPRLEGTVHVFNRTAERQNVLIDGKLHSELPGRGDATFSLQVGPHRLVAVGTRSGTAVENTVVIHSKVVHPWEIRPALAFVRIENRSPEPLDLTKDGGALGFVAPGSSRTYGPFPAGKTVLVAQGRWSRAIYESRVEMVGGRIEAWEIHPAFGAILCRNQRDEPMRLLLDGEERAVAEAHRELRLEVPLGTHLVELVGRRSHAQFRFRLRVRPDRTYAVVAPSGPARLQVSNQLPVPLSVRSDDALLGVVEPRSEKVFLLRELGERTFVATTPDSALRWHRRLRIDGERLFRWEVRP